MPDALHSRLAANGLLNTLEECVFFVNKAGNTPLAQGTYAKILSGPVYDRDTNAGLKSIDDLGIVGRFVSNE